jgi:hypothetical protein
VAAAEVPGDVVPGVNRERRIGQVPGGREIAWHLRFGAIIAELRGFERVAKHGAKDTVGNIASIPGILLDLDCKRLDVDLTCISE